MSDALVVAGAAFLGTLVALLLVAVVVVVLVRRTFGGGPAGGPLAPVLPFGSPAAGGRPQPDLGAELASDGHEADLEAANAGLELDTPGSPPVPFDDEGAG